MIEIERIKDSLKYSECDANEDEEEGKVNRDRIHRSLKVDKSGLILSPSSPL